MATRYKKGDKVKVKGIIFPVGGHWHIPITSGSVVSVEKPTKNKPYTDYKVHLDNKPKGFGYQSGYCRASDMKRA